MPAITRIGDLTIGVGSHGQPCCPHAITGIHIGGSPKSNANGQPVTRLNDITVHSCPHCGIGMNIAGSPTIKADGLPVTRVGDAVTEFCGSGTCVNGSPDVNADDG